MTKRFDLPGCDRWRWMAGIRFRFTACGSRAWQRVVLIDDRGSIWAIAEHPGNKPSAFAWHESDLAVAVEVDLADPATQGCLAAMLRETVHGKPSEALARVTDAWTSDTATAETLRAWLDGLDPDLPPHRFTYTRED